jgi:membrane protein implicated in regulation of membrane protease activity
MGSETGLWWLPGVLVAFVGVFAFIAGFVTGGPDTVDGVVFGSVALAAAAVILWRRAPKRGGPEPREDA